MTNGNSILNGARYFTQDGSQNCSIFQPFIKYFKSITNDVIMTWNSKGLSDESIKPLAISGNSLNLMLDYFNKPTFRVEFNERYFIIDSAGFSSKKINFYVIYNIKSWLYYIYNGFTLRNYFLDVLS